MTDLPGHYDIPVTDPELDAGRARLMALGLQITQLDRNGSLPLVGPAIVRPSSTGARFEIQGDGSTDLFNAAGELTFHTDPPSGDAPWLCPGCDICDGDGSRSRPGARAGLPPGTPGVAGAERERPEQRLRRPMGVSYGPSAP
jgi:hypothetical protein